MRMMESCHAAPYMGNEPFICVHHAGADAGEAWTLIERLAAEGYRVYYDGQAGEPARMQILNERLCACAAVLALYSSAAAASHDFRKVVTAAVFNQKPVLPVYLEEMELSAGMRMQVQNQTAIRWHSMDERPQIPADMLAACRGKPDPSVRIGQRTAGEKQAEGIREKRFLGNVSVIIENEEEVMRRIWARGSNAGQQGRGDMPAAAGRAAQRTVVPIRTVTVEAPPSRRMTEIIDEDDLMTGGRYGAHGTMILEEQPPLVLRLSSCECLPARCGITSVGRETSCDICIPERTISALHLEIISARNAAGVYRNAIRDCESTNGTWVDGVRMERGGQVEIDGSAYVGLGRKERCFVAFGGEAGRLTARGVIALLECRETQEIKVITDDVMTLGRSCAWDQGAFADQRISWEHAQIRREGGRYLLTDVGSSNGTTVNGGARLQKNVPYLLADGDEIVMGFRHFVFRQTEIRSV